MAGDFEPLSPEQKLFARLMFQNRVYQANGQRFEDLFTYVMRRRDPRFRLVKPQGSRGDEKNDGYVFEEGLYFQIHAPEDPEDKAAKAADKARDDFDGLKTHWDSEGNGIQEFRFAFNDKYLGVYPQIEHALNGIADEHGIKASTYTAADLEDDFMQLDPSEMEAVLKSVIPRPQFISDIDYGAMTEILQHLVDNQIPIDANSILSVPSFSDKIEFNDIDSAASLLIVGNYQNSAVDDYFNRQGNFTKRDTRDRLAATYERMRNEAENEDGDGLIGDRVFFKMLDEIAPNAERVVQDAAMVLIAYYFEKCDVFRDPPDQ